MIAKLHEVGGHNQVNSPFVRSVYFLDRSDVIAVLDPFRYAIPGAERSYIPFGGIRIKTGAVVDKMKFPPQTCIYSQQFKRTDSGVESFCQIDFPIPASRPDALDWYTKNAQKQLVCLFEDNNGRPYIFGNEERGARPAMSQSIGTTNEYFISVSGRFNVPTLMLNPKLGLDLSVLFPETDFSYDFSLDFNA